MAYAILATRAEFKTKKSNMGSLKIKDAHINRDENIAGIAVNANPNLSHLNQILIGNGNIYDAVKKEIDPIKYRPNQTGDNSPVVSYDIILTTGPEHFYKTGIDGKCYLKKDKLGFVGYCKRDDYDQRLNEWVEKAKEYLKNEHYCVGATLHLDELTPHIHAVSVPFVKLKDGKFDKTMTRGKTVINYKKFQDDYFAQVGKPLGLQRGIEGSEAVNVSNKTFWAGIVKCVKSFDNAKTAPLAAISKTFSEIKTTETQAKGFFFKKNVVVNRDPNDVKTEALRTSEKAVLQITKAFIAKNYDHEIALKKTKALLKQSEKQNALLQMQILNLINPPQEPEPVTEQKQKTVLQEKAEPSRSLKL